MGLINVVSCFKF